MRTTSWGRVTALVATLGVSGCSGCGETPPGPTDAGPVCTVEITAGRGTQRVTEARAGRTREAMRKVLFEKGCGKLCEADGVADDKRPACVARCQADIVGDQVGVRFRCDE